MATTPPFKYQPMFEKGKDTTEYYLLTKDYVSVSEFEGKPILKIEKEGLTAMANAAFRDVSFMLRRSHNEQVAKILSDPEASDNDKYVALTFLRNAEVASKGVLPFLYNIRLIHSAHFYHIFGIITGTMNFHIQIHHNINQNQQKRHHRNAVFSLHIFLPVLPLF